MIDETGKAQDTFLFQLLVMLCYAQLVHKHDQWPEEQTTKPLPKAKDDQVGSIPEGDVVSAQKKNASVVTCLQPPA